jgi:hypothetical protein
MLRYLQGTKDAGITFQGSDVDTDLTGYTDASYGGDEAQKSTSGYVFTVGGGAVSWKSKKQSIVAISSMEAEYIAMTEATKEAMWLSWIHEDILQTLQNKWELVKQRSDIKWELQDPADRTDSEDDVENSAKTVKIMHADNQSAIALAENPKHHDRSKHIAIRYHFIREAVQNRHINLKYLRSSDMVADALTKALPTDAHRRHAHSMGLLEV